MNCPVLTPEVCRSAGADAANRRMRAAGRSAWDAADHDVAAETCLRLARLGGFVPPAPPEPAMTSDGANHA